MRRILFWIRAHMLLLLALTVAANRMVGCLNCKPQAIKTHVETIPSPVIFHERVIEYPANQLFASIKARYQNDMDNPVAMREIGRILVQEGKTQEGVALLQKALVHGDVEALPEYGSLMFKSLPAAEQASLIESVEHGIRTTNDAESYFIYGLLIRDGFVTTRDPQSFMKWIQIASNYRYKPAQALEALYLVRRYVFGERLTQLLNVDGILEIPEASYAKGLFLEKTQTGSSHFKYYEAAAMKGLKDAQYDFACYLRAEAYHYRIKADPNIIIKWFEQAALNGHVDATLKVFRTYRIGISIAHMNVHIDERKATAFLMRLRHNPVVFDHILDYIYRDVKLKLTPEEFLDILREADGLGKPQASYLLAESLMYGRHGLKNQAAAVEILKRLYSQNVDFKSDVMYELAQAHHYGRGAPVDLNHAVNLYDEAARYGNIESQLLLARVYRNGEMNQSVNKKKSKEYREMARRRCSGAKIGIADALRVSCPLMVMLPGIPIRNF